MTLPKCLTAAASGSLFGLGLVVSDMVNPARVLAFLDVTGAFDPSLIWVMVGAIATLALGRRFFAGHIHEPQKPSVIDRKLLLGAAIFGIGWGLSGLCPGPALANITLGSLSIYAFVPAMLIGLYLVRR